MDELTVSAIAALVLFVAGLVFLLETLLRREIGSGRVWAVGFLAGMLAAVSYALWHGFGGAWLPSAVGDVALIVTTAAYWLGCREVNGRAQRIPVLIVTVVAIIQLATTVIAAASRHELYWSWFMFFAVAAFAGLGCVESRRGEMGAMVSAIGFTTVFAVLALFYVGRGVVLIAAGTDSDLFRTWFGSTSTGLLAILVTIVALSTATAIRTGRVTVRRRSDATSVLLPGDGILEPDDFNTILSVAVQRAEPLGETVAMVAVRIEDLSQIGVAFGPRRRSRSRTSGERAPGVTRRRCRSFAVCSMTRCSSRSPAHTPEYAMRIGNRIHRGLQDGFSQLGSAVIPVVGVGIALTSDTGYSASRLIAAAQRAAHESAESPDASVILHQSAL